MALPLTVGLVWLICSSITQCESAKEANAVPKKCCNHRKSCRGKTYDIREAVCCEDQLHSRQGLSCCGEQPFNPAADTCCQVRRGSTLSAKVTRDVSGTVSDCCDLEAYNPLNQMCCDSAIVPKPVAMAQCCGKRAFDEEKQMCCGPMQRVLTRLSINHRCCAHQQFDYTTQCCCDGLKIQPKTSTCCEKESAQAIDQLNKILRLSNIVTNTVPEAQYCDKDSIDTDTRLCCGPSKKLQLRTSIHHRCCGEEQYDSKTECCSGTDTLQINPINSVYCEDKLGVRPQIPIPQPKCTEPKMRICGSSCYNPHELKCCERESTTSHFNSGGCDATPTVYDPITQICCDGCLSKKEPWIHQFHSSLGQHCCGTETYQPHHEICCDGHSHLKGEHTHCCGIHAYNIDDLQLKCCAGTLYNLTSSGSNGNDAQCCGSVLQKNQDVCCSGGEQEVRYSKESGNRCCGHLYYNTSLWSCCAEKLSPLHQPEQAMRNNESSYPSVNNLNTKDLCKERNIGTVESVSLHSVLFHNVFKIHAVDGTVKALASPYILRTPDRCNKPKVIPGRTYFFDEVHVFPGVIHDPFQSIPIIISKCHKF